MKLCVEKNDPGQLLVARILYETQLGVTVVGLTTRHPTL